VLDNSSTHKTPQIQRWLVRHPRFTLHFTPTYGFPPSSRSASVACCDESPAALRVEDTISSVARLADSTMRTWVSVVAAPPVYAYVRCSERASLVTLIS